MTIHRAFHRLVQLLAIIGVTACAGTPADPDAEARREETLADILNQPLDADEYGKVRRCISSTTYRDFQPLDDRFLVFEGPGGKLWLNEVRGRCPGLKQSSTLAFKQHGMQLCELDQFKVVDVFTWARYRRLPWHWLEGIPCTLGEFRPVTEAQVEAIRATVR